MRFPNFQTVILALEIYRCLCAQPPDRNMHVDDSQMNGYLCVKPDPQKQLYSFKPERQLDCPVCTAGCKNNSKVSYMQFSLGRMQKGTQRGMGSICSVIIHAAAVAHQVGSVFGGISSSRSDEIGIFEETSHGVNRRAIIELLFENADRVVKKNPITDSIEIYLKPYLKFKQKARGSRQLNLPDMYFGKLKEKVGRYVDSYYCHFPGSQPPVNNTAEIIRDDFLLILRQGSLCGIREELAKKTVWRKEASWNLEYFRWQIKERFRSNKAKESMALSDKPARSSRRVNQVEKLREPYILKVAMHIREGDGGNTRLKYVKQPFGSSYYYDVLDGLRDAVYNLYGTKVEVDMHIFTSCVRENQCQMIRTAAEKKYARHNISMHLGKEFAGGDIPTMDLMNAMSHFITADVFILSHSSLSYVAGIFNPNCVVYEPVQRFGPLRDWSELKLPDKHRISELKRKYNDPVGLKQFTNHHFSSFWMSYLPKCLKMEGLDQTMSKDDRAAIKVVMEAAEKGSVRAQEYLDSWPIQWLYSPLR